MADIQYLNYGDQQIEQQAFLNKAANEVQNYVQSQPWSRKRKEKFMSAYSDLMNRGVLGASNSSGQWVLDIGGEDLGLDSKNTKDKEMYQEAAYFIQQQMAGMPTKSAQAEEEKKDLPVFDNKYFTEALHHKIGSEEFGGRDWDTQNDWNNLDARGENGLRGRSKRAETLSRHLQEYANSLEEGKYNFEGSPFADLNDFRARIGNAVEALKNPNNEEGVTTALNRLGLRASDYFNNGSGDLSNTINPATNQPFTYSELAQYNQQQAELKQKQQLQAQQQAKKNAYNSALVLTRGSSKLKGMDSQALKAKYQDSNNLIAALQGYSQRNLNDLTPDEQSELHGIYKNLANAPIDNKLLKAIQATARYKGASPNRFRKINGVDGFIFDTVANQVIQVKSRGQFEADKNQTQPDLFTNVKTPEEKMKLAGERKVNDGEWKAEDYTRMAAMGQDIAGTVAALLPGYGTAASATLGTTALATNFAADWMDDSVSRGEMWKNAGINLGLGLVGLVPGLGLASKSGRWITTAAKWAPRILTMAAAGEVALSPEIRASVAKLNSNETLTVNDWKNIGFALSTVAGVTRGARGVVDNRKYKAAFKGTTKSELNIVTKSGKKVSATKEDVERINKAGRKGGTEEANKELRKIKGAENEEVGVDFKTGRFSKRTPGNKVKTEIVTTTAEASPRVQAYQRALKMQNDARKAGKGIYKFAPRFLHTSYDIYKGAATLSLPQTKVIDRFKQMWNPISEGKSKKTTSAESKTTVKGESTSKTTTPERVERFNKATTKRLEDLNKEKFSKAKLKSGDYDLGGHKIQVVEQSDGTFNLIYKGNIEGNYLKSQQKEIQKAVRDIVNSRTRNIEKNKVEKIGTKELGKILQDLKRKGWLKQGGTINKQKIQNYLNFINK